jgi:DNA-binding LytR/AlgR family response regulator
LDDELPGLTYLKMLCEQISEIEVVRAFNNPVIFLKECQGIEFDLCILDIEMPEINGLEVAKLLNRKPVIFTTAYKDYAAEAFDLFAIDYVRKPVQMDRLQLAVQKALKHLQTEKKSGGFTQLNTDRGKSIIYFDQIAYIKTAEVDSRDKYLKMNDGKGLTLKNISFEKLLELLPSSKFCQINKKEIISVGIVMHFSNDEIVTNIVDQNNKNMVLNLGISFRSDFLKKIKRNDI